MAILAVIGCCLLLLLQASVRPYAQQGFCKHYYQVAVPRVESPCNECKTSSFSAKRLVA
jgi:hypothetical protein